MHKVLTIAGSDSGGGAGIQADLKTMLALGVFGMSAVTALTAQNTLGVTAIQEASPEMLAAQIDAVFVDLRPGAVKLGMIPSAELMTVTADRLRFWGAETIVVDPVMVATSGAALMESSAVKTLKSQLLPLATLVTPNIPEAEVLAGIPIGTEADMRTAARRIYEDHGCAVLLKGGHSVRDANDLLWSEDGGQWFRGRRIDNPNTHGTGCTLSAAIAAYLVRGYSLAEAVAAAKAYLTGALAAQLNLGIGSGPLNHGWEI